MLLSLLTFIVVVAIIGAVLWFATTYVPMPQPLKQVLVVVVALLVLLYAVRWVLTSGVLPGL